MLRPVEFVFREKFLVKYTVNINRRYLNMQTEIIGALIRLSVHDEVFFFLSFFFFLLETFDKFQWYEIPQSTVDNLGKNCEASDKLISRREKQRSCLKVRSNEIFIGLD